MDDFICECKSIADKLKCEFSTDSARTLTTFRGGGSACVFYPRCESEFIDVYATVGERLKEPFVLGGGSDTVIADGLCKTPVVSTKRLSGVRYADGRVYAGSGAQLMAVTRKFREMGLCGLEFLCGVPLSVGGALRMNAGAFGKSAGDCALEIRILAKDGENNFRALTKRREELDLGYRRGVSGIILGATFVGESGSEEKSLLLAKEYLNARAKKQPKYPSCGSVFKNGEKPSGALIEGCGLKGARIGGAQISSLHANFIVNRGGATGTDFITLAELAEQSVLDRYGVKLEREFVYLR